MKNFEITILKYLKARGWENLNPGDLAKSIAIESGELLELFQWSNPTLKELKANIKQLEKVKKELADVMTYCFDLAVLLEIDTEKTLNKKLVEVKKKYPARLMKKASKSSAPGSDELYWEIKRKHRMQGK